uniref:hypothetical protein n=1 Tax=Micromonospora acroterricola TaxID=2202421 RepID=UPI0011B38DC5|nr:hypothetical protein [Micromonospora acroterricola]
MLPRSAAPAGDRDPYQRGHGAAGGDRNGFRFERNAFRADRGGIEGDQAGFGNDGGVGRDGARLRGARATGGVPHGHDRNGDDGPVGYAAAAGVSPANDRLGVARTVDSGPWPALPTEPVWSGHETGGPVSGRAGAGTGASVRTVGGAWSAVASDLWPALPDDRPLWTVPGAALDATQLGRLEREQAGD